MKSLTSDSGNVHCPHPDCTHTERQNSDAKVNMNLHRVLKHNDRPVKRGYSG